MFEEEAQVQAGESSEVAPAFSPRDAFKVALPNFEGPLDLLLHLIKEHQLDIFDIPIALVTEKYLEHLARMRTIDLDIAGEFLVMASTLAHIKSRLLVPRPVVVEEGPPEEAQDPRAELVRRLLEYQKYKSAGEALAEADLLDRDVFARRVRVDKVPLADDELGLVEVSVFKLVEALDRALAKATPGVQHEVVMDRVTISDAIHRLADRLSQGERIAFSSVFEGQRQRQQIVVTFLALLEMCRLKLIRVFQDPGGGEIFLVPAGVVVSPPGSSEVQENEYR